MITSPTFDGSLFRLKRPIITTNGSSADVDPDIANVLTELNMLLGKRIFAPPPANYDGDPVIAGPEEANGKKGGGRSGANAITPAHALHPLKMPLTPKRVPAVGGTWAEKSILEHIYKLPERADHFTLGDYIDATADLSSLKYAFQSTLSDAWNNLDYNTKAVLDGTYPAVGDYLIACGYYLMGLQDANALKNFVVGNRLGTKNIVNYCVVSTARYLVDQKQLIVPKINDDDGDIALILRAGNLLLSVNSFKTSEQAIIDNYIYNASQSLLIDEAEKKIGPLPSNLKLQLVAYIKSSPVPITKDNVAFFLPQFISQIQSSQPATIVAPDPGTTDLSDQDFNVDYLSDTDAMVQISRTAVKCAAQLFYSMTMGDELDVFGVAHHFTHKYLIRGQIEIQDSTLRNDLQMYVFSNKFTDLKTGRLLDRTRPSERRMFYRQVFGNYANAKVSADVVVNSDFPKLWKVLILESAKYLENARASYNPDSYVSRQNVMQAVEDLQYNLSLACTGMANVIAPIIYAELNFIIQRIFMNPTILTQIVPAGGTWWRVVETLYTDMKKTRPRATVIYNKAKLGNDIIRSIADYDPSTFEDDSEFSAFISSVDAFITTQSIIQDALTDDLKNAQEDPETSPALPRRRAAAPRDPDDSAPSSPPVPTAGHDEWDF